MVMCDKDMQHETSGGFCRWAVIDQYRETAILFLGIARLNRDNRRSAIALGNDLFSCRDEI